jgi:glycosyltransferase involved in cell wall biosynthesis
VASEGQAGRGAAVRPDPLRILLVSHTYVTPENRGKLGEMGRHARLRALVPERGQDIAGAQRPGATEARGYELVSLPIAGRTRPGTRWIFTRWRDAWAGFDPHAVVLEQEVWSLAMLQGLACRRRYAPRASLTLYAWESLERPGWRGPATRPFYRHAIRAASSIMVGNRDTRALFLRHGAEASRLFVTPQVGLDPRALAPVTPEERRRHRRSLGLDEDAFVVGFAGRFVPEKGVADLVQAAGGFRPQGARAQLALLGAGPLEAVLRAHARAGRDLTILPPFPRDQIAPFYQSLDAFVLPSRTTPTWKEQFGMAAAEAMACGVPVLGSSSGAIPDLLGRTGLLFPEGDLRALAAALERLAGDPVLRADLGAAGRRRSARLFSHEAVAATTLRAIEIGLGEARDRPLAYCDVAD